MPGSGLGGLAEGLWGYVDKERQLSQERDNTAAQREAQLYSLLAEHGTDEFASMGLAGLAEMANPKRKAKGMRGFLGEMEASQTLPRIRELMATPQQRAVNVPGLPSRGIPQQATMATPPPAPSGEQGRMQAALAGQPPPAPEARQASMNPSGLPDVLPQDQIARGGPPPAPGEAFTELRGTPAVGRVDQVSEARQVLMRPEERISRDTIARERSKVEGEVAGLIATGMSDQEARQLIKQKYERLGRGRAGQFQKQAVEVPNAEGGTDVMFAAFDPNLAKFFDPDTGALIENAKPVSSSARMSFGIEAERAARAKYGKSFGQLTSEESADIVNNELPKIAGQISGARATETGKANNVTKLNAPLSVDDSAQLGVGVGTPMAAVAGQVPQTPQMQEIRRSITGMKVMLPNALVQIKAALPSKNDLIGNLAPGLVMKARRLDPAYREKIAAAEAAVNLLVNNIARVVAGAKGAQSEPDAMRAESALMNLKEGWISGDTAESAEARMQEAEKAIDAVLATLPPELTTSPVAGSGTPPPSPYSVGQRVRLRDGSWKEITSVTPLRWKASTPPAPTVPQ